MVRVCFALPAFTHLVIMEYVLLVTKTVQFAILIQAFVLVALLDNSPQVLLARFVPQALFLQDQLHVLPVLLFV